MFFQLTSEDPGCCVKQCTPETLAMLGSFGRKYDPTVELGLDNLSVDDIVVRLDQVWSQKIFKMSYFVRFEQNFTKNIWIIFFREIATTRSKLFKIF